MKPVVAGGEDFRPVGIAIAADGSVFISDWVDKSYTLHGQGRIWRLRASGAPAPDRVARNTGRAALKNRRIAAELAAAAGAGKVDGQLASSTLRHDSADVRALAVSILPAENITLKDVAAADPSPLVRAAAMRRLAKAGAKELLLKALESDDPFIQQAARLGLRNSLEPAEIVALAGSKALSAEERLGLLLILRESPRTDARTVLPGFLADPDPRIRFAAIQWVGEHRLTEFRSQLQKALASTAETRNLFEAALAALEQLDGKTRGIEDEIAGEDYVAALIKNPRTPDAVLRHALRMLRPDHPALSIDLFRRLLKKDSEPIRIEAVRILCQSPRRGRFEILDKLVDDPHASITVRAEAVAGLADDASVHHEQLLKLASGEEPVLRHEAVRACAGFRCLKASIATSNSKPRRYGRARAGRLPREVGRGCAIAARTNRDFGERH